MALFSFHECVNISLFLGFISNFHSRSFKLNKIVKSFFKYMLLHYRKWYDTIFKSVTFAKSNFPIILG